MSRPNGASGPSGTAATGAARANTGAAPRPARKRKKSPKPKEAKRARPENSPAMARTREAGGGMRAGSAASDRPAPGNDDRRWAEGSSECGPAPTPPNGSAEPTAPTTITTIRLRPTPRTADSAVQTTAPCPFGGAAGLQLLEYQTAVTRETGLLLRELLRAQLGGPAAMPATPALDRGATGSNGTECTNSAEGPGGVKMVRAPSAQPTGWVSSNVPMSGSGSQGGFDHGATTATMSAPPPRDYFALSAAEAAAASPADTYAMRGGAPLSAPVLPMTQDSTPAPAQSTQQPNFVQSAFPQTFRAPLSQQQMQQLALMQHQRQAAMARQVAMGYGTSAAASAAVPRTMPAPGSMGPPQRPFLNVNTALANTFQNTNPAATIAERDEGEYAATPETEHSYAQGQHGHGQVQVLGHTPHTASHNPTPGPSATAFLQSPAYSPAPPVGDTPSFLQHGGHGHVQSSGQVHQMPNAQSQAYARALAHAQAQAMAQAQAAQAQAAQAQVQAQAAQTQAHMQAQAQHQAQQAAHGLGLVGAVQVGILGGGSSDGGGPAPAPALFAPPYANQNFTHNPGGGDLQSPFSFVAPPLDESGAPGGPGTQAWGVPDDRSEEELREISPSHHDGG